MRSFAGPSPFLMSSKRSSMQNGFGESSPLPLALPMPLPTPPPSPPSGETLTRSLPSFSAPAPLDPVFLSPGAGDWPAALTLPRSF